MIRISFSIAALSGLLVVFAGAQSRAGDTSEGSIPIAVLVEQLGDSDFAVREAATQRLHYVDAVPLLVRAVDHDDPEVSWRAMHVLVNLSESADESTHKIAARALKTLSASPNDNIARFARCALEARQHRAAARLHRQMLSNVPRYMSDYPPDDDVQYFVPGPEFKLVREAAAMKVFGEDQAINEP